MGGLLAGLATLAQPILARVLIALGMSVVTIGGVVATGNALKSLLLDKLAGLPMVALQLAGLLGVWEGLGMILGAVTFSLSYWAMTRAVRIVGAG